MPRPPATSFGSPGSAKRSSPGNTRSTRGLGRVSGCPPEGQPLNSAASRNCRGGKQLGAFHMPLRPSLMASPFSSAIHRLQKNDSSWLTAGCLSLPTAHEFELETLSSTSNNSGVHVHQPLSRRLPIENHTLEFLCSDSERLWAAEATSTLCGSLSYLVANPEKKMDGGRGFRVFTLKGKPKGQPPCWVCFLIPGF